jgi:prolyl 4-hydroxylase
MKIHCAAACRSCEAFSFDLRCRNIHYDVKDGVWTQPGDVNATFTSIIERYSPNITIISQERPWILVLDDFLTAAECDHLIDQGKNKGYERSGETVQHRGGKKNHIMEEQQQQQQSMMKVVSPNRTSTNAWCYEPCYSHPTTQHILHKLETLTGGTIPDTHSEYLQLLRYEPGQFYAKHSYVIARDKHRAPGLRIMTVFLYLNNVEQGGETRFPNIDKMVQPKQGRVVIWPNVLNAFVTTADPLTMHEALPVIKGVKYAANSWIHNRDFKTPHAQNCIWNPADTGVATNDHQTQQTQQQQDENDEL